MSNANTKKAPAKLNPAMKRALVEIRDGVRLTWRLETYRALCRRGLVDTVDGKEILTDAGKALVDTLK